MRMSRGDAGSAAWGALLAATAAPAMAASVWHRGVRCQASPKAEAGPRRARPNQLLKTRGRGDVLPGAAGRARAVRAVGHAGHWGGTRARGTQRPGVPR